MLDKGQPIANAEQMTPFVAYLWLTVLVATTLSFLSPGLDALLLAWNLPEYSHGPLIPVLSGLLFLRQLKTVPERPGAIPDRWPGIFVLSLALILGAIGRMAAIDDIVAYALILWVGAVLLFSFGWQTGKHFWPGVLHLVYMLPLPDTLYYKLSTYLQFISSELGVWFLQLLAVPVFLEGNIIDLGVLKLHVAEACSGLRYLFPILSFSYIFAVLYRGPMWHKAVLLISAAPITILMNSVRIAIGGVLVNSFGEEWLEGFSHFFEGWVIFVSCILILFGVAWVMLRFQRKKMGLAEALDLDTEGLWTQATRIRLLQPSRALIAAALMTSAAALSWQLLPERNQVTIPRDSFAIFPRDLGDWTQDGPQQRLDANVEITLGADDYIQSTLAGPAAESVGLFMAWYNDQGRNGVHSPEICLPGAGWEIAWLERTDVTAQTGSPVPFEINKAIIQKRETRMLVFYWFQQKDRRIAWDIAAKFWLLIDGIRTGRTDGAIVRLTTTIGADEPDAAAEARLMSALLAVQDPLPRFIPGG